MAVTIRKMKKEDLEAAIAILSNWNMVPIEPSPEIPNPERSGIRIENSFVAVDGDKIVGMSSYIIHSPELAETASLAVSPEYRGKGIGYRLQLARLKEMKEKGVKTLRTETHRPETIEWYLRKFGYRVIGTRKKRHPHGMLDIDYQTILELDLENYDIQ